MDSKFIKAGELNVHYFQVGSGSPLVLLHGGLATSQVMWGGRVEELAQDFHVYAMDSRGHGQTDNPADHLSYAQMAGDVLAFLDTLDIEKPLIVGYSDGGQIGLEFGIRYPGRARALVLGGTISQPSPVYLDGLHNWGFVAPGEVDLDKLATAFGPFLDIIKREHGSTPDYWRTLLRDISGLWHRVPAYTDAQLAQIVDPTLILMGDRDEMAGKDEAWRLYQGVKQGELGIVPNSAHGAADKPLFWDMVRDFSRRHS